MFQSSISPIFPEFFLNTLSEFYLSPSTDATIYTYTAQMPFRWPTCETLPHFHGFVMEMVKILAPLTQENLINAEKRNVFPNDYKNVT